MKTLNPKFNHPALHLLETLPTKTLSTFKQIHSQFINAGLALHTYPLSRLLFFSSSLSLSYSLSLLLHSQSPHPPSIFLFNTLISSLSNLTHPPTHLALSLYSTHLLHPLSPSKPNAHTYPSLLKACGTTHHWAPHGFSLHAHILKFDLHLDPFVLSALLNFYCMQGRLSVARHLFDEIPEPDLPTWNSILAAYSRCGPVMETLVLFQRMLVTSLDKPNEITLVAVVSACGDLGALGRGIWAHGYVIRNGLSMNRFVGTAVIEMYAKCGRLDLAEQMFDRMPQRDTMCYNAILRGLATHGRGRRAIDLFRRMEIEGARVDDVTMVVVLNACAHSGLVDEGRRYFDRMHKDFGIEAKSEHYGCLVDLLGRAGEVEEAERVIAEMPMKPNAVLYRSLLGACKLHGEQEMGERLVSQLILLEPGHGGNYVLQSNMLANTSQWDDVGKVRKLMREKGINKTPGLSLVEMDGVMHEFVMGDTSHSQSTQIYAMLDEIGRRLHEYGHRARTKEVLFDVEEEDKEDALSYHSERLAIAFALLASESSSPIRIIKNLRVCGDCHSSTKLVSLIYRREIIVRDRNRFHHFRNGSCSCSDYW